MPAAAAHSGAPIGAPRASTLEQHMRTWLAAVSNAACSLRSVRALSNGPHTFTTHQLSPSFSLPPLIFTGHCIIACSFPSHGMFSTPPLCTALCTSRASAFCSPLTLHASMGGLAVLLCAGPYLLLLLFLLGIFCATAHCTSLRFNPTSSLFLSFKCSRHEVACVLVCSAAQCPAVKLAHPQHTGTAGTQHAHSEGCLWAQ